MTDLTKRPAVNPGGRGHNQGMVRRPPAATGKGPGMDAGDSKLSSAVEELNGQNPQKWNDLGPHHHDNYKGKTKGGY